MCLLSFATSLRAENPRVLIIGTDGCRPDALAAANTPNYDKLAAAGVFLNDTKCLPARQTGADSISGPGWSSMLTGVWADKHGVLNNEFAVKHYDQYPHFFARLKAARPDAETYSVAHWSPIAVHIVSTADKNETADSDDETEAKIIAALTDGNPVAAFVHFNESDSTGHSKGFSPAVPEYIAAIEGVDARVGRIVEAVRSRPTYDQEDWLILVSSDHGGEGTGHSGGFTNPAVGTMFIIASGKAFEGVEIERQSYIVDVAATALRHLGVEIQDEWKLDGAPLQQEANGSDAESTAPGYVSTSQYEPRDISGWNVMINKTLLDEQAELGDEAISILQAKLDEIRRLVPEKACEELQRVPIWLGVDDGHAPCAEYHPSKRWLVDNGYNPDKARCVEIGCARNFVQWTNYQPAMVLHELAHAYHDQVLGFNSDEVSAVWRAAKDSGAYDSVLHIQGGEKPHYGLNNAREFFAEATEAYFSTNDFFPFVRPELQRHDPRTFELVKTLWGD